MGVRKLRKQISRKVFERTENANLQIIENKNIEQGIFKDPYLLDFLKLENGFLEEDDYGVVKPFNFTVPKKQYCKVVF